MASAALVFQALLGLAVGVVVAFAGYRLARSVSVLAGFLTGFTLGLVLGIFGGPIVSLVAAVVFGIVFALLFAFAFRIVGGALGGLATFALAGLLGWPTWLVVLAVIVGAIIGFVANRLMVILATAALGGWLATRSGFELLEATGVAVTQDDLVRLAVAAVVATLGAVVQWRAARET